MIYRNNSVYQSLHIEKYSPFIITESYYSIPLFPTK